jgi:hypothetical protein
MHTIPERKLNPLVSIVLVIIVYMLVRTCPFIFGNYFGWTSSYSGDKPSRELALPFEMRVRAKFLKARNTCIPNLSFFSLHIKLHSFPHTILAFGCYGYVLPQRHHDWWFLDVSMLSCHTKDPVSRWRSWYRSVLCWYCELQQWLQHKLRPLLTTHYKLMNMAG